jgi:hypothetical protein
VKQPDYVRAVHLMLELISIVRKFISKLRQVYVYSMDGGISPKIPAAESREKLTI